MIMLVILRNKSNNNTSYMNTDFSFSYKDNINKEQNTLRRIRIPNFTPGQIIYFPCWLYLSSTDYQLDIMIRFVINEKKADQEVKMDMLVQKQFKLSPKIALDVKFNYSLVDKSPEPVLFVQILMTNQVHFPIKIMSVEIQDSESYNLQTITPNEKHIPLVEKGSYSIVLGLVSKKNELAYIDKSAVGNIKIIWKPMTDISEGGVLSHNLVYKNKANFEELSLFCDQKIIEYGQSNLVSIRVKNNTNLIQSLKIGNKEDRSCAIGIHTIDLDVLKIDAKKESVFQILIYGRKKGIHKLRNLKMVNSLNNKGISYDPLEYEVK